MAEEQPDPKSMKVVELREELSKRGLDTKGLKKDLIDRLESAQHLDQSGGTELAPLNDDLKDSAQPLGHIDSSREDSVPSAITVAPEKLLDPPITGPIKDLKVGAVDGDGIEAKDGGVGHVMVEGANERTREIHELAKEQDVEAVEKLEPAALDEDVAHDIAVEEVREALPLSPSPPRRISPLAADMDSMDVPSPTAEAIETMEDSRDRKLESLRQTKVKEAHEDQQATILTPPLETTMLPTDMSQGKRARSSTPEGDALVEKKKFKGYAAPLPSSLSHLKHRPTTVLYIRNLRRPLLHANLHEYLYPDSTPPPSSTDTLLMPPPSSPFSNPDYPGLWLSGIKDHAYAVYLGVEDAIEAAERIENVQWPSDTGEKLKIEFIDEDELKRIIEREEFAWRNGRQKLILNIKEEDGLFTYELSVDLGGGKVGPPVGLGPGSGQGLPTGPSVGMGRPGRGVNGPGGGRQAPVSVPLTGTNALGPGRGGSGVMSIRGRGGYGNAPPLGLGRNGQPNLLPPGAGRREEGRIGNPMKRTQARPALFWREGPGATKV